MAFYGIRHSIIAVLLFFIPFLASANAPELTYKQIKKPPPKIIRTCCAFGADIGFAGIPFARKNDITEPGLIGSHRYLGSHNENNGIIYTHKGGFLDMGHLRDCADWTAYLYNLILASYDHPELKEIRLGYEGGSKKLILKIPEDFDPKDAIELAAKMAYDISVWHEISTWFGASYIPMVPERYSSFSPEDLYSNLIGTFLATQAIKSSLDYDSAMTLLIAEMLNQLDAVTKWNDTYKAMEKVNKLWYNGNKRFPNKNIIIKRFLDNETALHPWQIPDDENLQEPFILHKPDSSYTNYYELQIKPSFKIPARSIVTKPDGRYITQNDFPVLIKRIQLDIEIQDLKKNIRQLKIEKRKSRKSTKPTL
ncbi:MAG: hypothetical protein CSA36_03850 [Draconibacterium sp.]|nr:MAG: hypothetical protein CSA36_03850 [Draconibacterium sp.]